MQTYQVAVQLVGSGEYKNTMRTAGPPYRRVCTMRCVSLYQQQKIVTRLSSLARTRVSQCISFAYPIADSQKYGNARP